MSKLRIGFVALMLMTSASGAWALGKGTCMFAAQLTSGTVDYANPENGTGFITAGTPIPEWGGQGQLWYMMADDYALAISAGAGVSSEKAEPGTNAPANSPTKKATSSSFHVTLGGDRVVKVADRALLYFGPNVEWWSGKVKYENVYGVTPPLNSVETATTSRISLGGRMGGMMMIGESWGVGGSIGHKVGMASAKEKGAKVSWFPSSFDGAGGLTFFFGGQ